MGVGLIARAENRGLGNQTWQVAMGLRPDRVLVVDMGDLGGGFPMHVDRYTDLGLNVTVLAHDKLGDVRCVGPWLEGLDVVYTAETFYAVDFPAIARDHGVATVCHLNPEFYKHGHEPLWPQPSAWWLPSPWLFDDPRLPADATMVRTPAPYGWMLRESERAPGPLRVLHVAGKPAMGDRNGSRGLLMALRHITADVEVTVRAQAASFPHPARVGRGVRYMPDLGDKPDYRTMYAGFDVLVLPRRYGGLCMPVIEAAAAGLAVVMTDCAPNGAYPARLVDARSVESVSTPLGQVRAFDSDPRALAAAIDELARDPYALCEAKDEADKWARAMSWDYAAPLWRDMLAEVAARA